MSVAATSAKLSMVTLLGASTPVGTPTPDVWLQWGLAGVVVAFTLWRDHHREKRMAAAIERQEAWVRTTLLVAVEKNTTALNDITQIIRDNRRLPPDELRP